MKYKDPAFIAQLKAWIENPCRCRAFQLPDLCNYSNAQHIGPALLRLEGLDGADLDYAIEEECQNSKNLTSGMLYFLVYQVYERLHPMVDFQQNDPLALERNQILITNEKVGLHPGDPYRIRQDLQRLGKRLLSLGVQIERVRIEVLLQTYSIAYYYHQWDNQVTSKEETLLMDEIGRPLLQSMGIPLEKTAWYEALSAFKKLATALAGSAPPNHVLCSDFRLWYRVLIERIAERSKSGPQGFEDVFPLMQDLPRLREYGQCEDNLQNPGNEDDAAGSSKNGGKRTPEEAAQKWNTKSPKQRATFIIKTVQKIDDSLRIIDLIDMDDLALSSDDILAARKAFEAGLKKLDDLAV
jgi:hypothetical protein